MVCVAGGPVTGKFRIYFRASGPRVFQFFQNHHAGSLSHHKAVPLFVKRNGSPQRVRAVGQSGQGGKTCHADGRDGALGASGQHHVGIPALDTAERFPDGVGSGGAGGDHIDALSLQPELDADVSGRHIADHHGNQHRVHAARPSGEQPLVLPLDGLEAADSGTNADSDPEGILLFHL